MVSNDVEALADGEACDALLLTAKARIVAPLRVLRRAADDFLLLTEPELGETVRMHLLRTRFAANAEIEREEHESWFVLGSQEVIDERPPGEELTEDQFERWRIESGIPRAVSSTTECCRPKPDSTRRTSASQRAATPARNRSRASGTAGRSTAAYACSMSEAMHLQATSCFSTGNPSAASPAPSPAWPSAMCAPKS
jgi:folate-binding Fe-S cluster repair protein YgfZ